MHLATSILDGIEVLSDLPADAEAMPSAVRSALHERAAAELPNLVTRLSALYANRFTTDELEQLLAFHRTPVPRSCRPSWNHRTLKRWASSG